jgi:hypothetical protein
MYRGRATSNPALDKRRKHQATPTRDKLKLIKSNIGDPFFNDFDDAKNTFFLYIIFNANGNRYLYLTPV